MFIMQDYASKCGQDWIVNAARETVSLKEISDKEKINRVWERYVDNLKILNSESRFCKPVKGGF